jgi:hypothetical protein
MPRPNRTCEWCERRFYTPRPFDKARLHRFCCPYHDKLEYMSRTRPHYTGKCQECGTSFDTWKPGQKFHSRRCAALARWKAKRANGNRRNVNAQRREAAQT